MSENLNDELEAIRSIYGDQILRAADAGVYVLTIPESPSPQFQASLRLSFPPNYPESSPQVLGTEATGENAAKGSGKRMVEVVKTKLQEIFIPGSVCLFDLLQELHLSFTGESEIEESLTSNHLENSDMSTRKLHPPRASELGEVPEWMASAVVTEKKSTFVARACDVKSPQQAKNSLVHLLDTDKRAAKATHNITAYRIRSPAAPGSTTEITYQDCDDDGETAAGGRLLHLLQVMDVWDILVVVSRWYGGVKLGPDRFSIINNVARDAVVRGGWTTRGMTKA